VNSQEWDEFVNNDANSKLYQTYEWSQLISEVHGYKLFMLEEDNGLLPLAYVKSLIFGDRLISIPFADYGGPCARSESAANLLISKAEGIATKLDVDFIEVRSPSEEYFEVFERRGFVRRDDYFTFILPLDQELDLLWKGIGDKNRNMVRKAEKNSMQIRHAKDESDVNLFYELYLKTMRGLGSPPNPHAYFEKIWSLFYPKNAVMLMAVYKDKCIASSLYFIHGDKIHYAYNCSLTEYAELAPNNLIQWYIIKWGNEHGFKQLDFGRTREKGGNVLFKRRWGGKQVSMPYFYKFYKKELKERQELKYQGLSKLWSKYMPGYLARKIGPWLIRQIG